MQIVKRSRVLTVGLGQITWKSVAYAAACALPLVTGLVISGLALPVPYQDEWDWADLIYRMHLGALTLSDLWKQHNEHRMLVPNLIALGLASLGGWSQLRETLFSLLLVIVTQIGLFVLLRRIAAARVLPFAFLAVSLLLYSLIQMENWDWGFQYAWFLCNLCVVWMLVFLGSAGQSSFSVLAAATLAVVASVSLSQGLLAWFAGLVALLLTEKRRPMQIAVWLVLTVATFVVYFHGYEQPAQHPDPFLALHRPLMALRYIGVYFGAVLAVWLGFTASLVVGWLGLTLMTALIALVIAIYRRDRQRASRAGSFVGLAGYAVGVGLITMAGRLGFGADQAIASRYTSVSIYCWIVIIALLAGFQRELRPRLSRGLVRLWPLVPAAFFVLYIGSDKAGLGLGSGILARVRSTYPALIVGHGRELGALYPGEMAVEGWIKELQAVKDGPYYK